MTEFVDDINLDLAFNNVKPKDWYFVLDYVRFSTELGSARTSSSGSVCLSV